MKMSKAYLAVIVRQMQNPLHACEECKSVSSYLPTPGLLLKTIISLSVACIRCLWIWINLNWIQIKGQGPYLVALLYGPACLLLHLKVLFLDLKSECLPISILLYPSPSFGSQVDFSFPWEWFLGICLWIWRRLPCLCLGSMDARLTSAVGLWTVSVCLL